MIDDPNARADALLHGRADLMTDVAPDRIADLRTRAASELRIRPQPFTAFLFFNARRPPFDDVRARRAVNLAIDRRAVTKAWGGPRVAAPTCQMLPSHFPGHVDRCPWTRGPQDGRWHGTDVPRARALVRASGTSGMRVGVIAEPDDPAGPSSGRAAVSALRAIGYRPRLEVMPTEGATGRRITDPDSGWNGGVDFVPDAARFATGVREVVGLDPVRSAVSAALVASPPEAVDDVELFGDVLLDLDVAVLLRAGEDPVGVVAGQHDQGVGHAYLAANSASSSSLT